MFPKSFLQSLLYLGICKQIFFRNCIQFELFSEYFFSICDFIEKSKTTRPSLSYEELFCEPYILYLQCKFSVNNSSFLKQLDLGSEKSELQEILIDGCLDRFLYSKFPTINSNKYLQDCNFCSYKDQIEDKTISEKVKNQSEQSFCITTMGFSTALWLRLLFHMCEMYNDFVDKNFALPTPAMSFISQLAINIETTRRLTRGIETEMRDGDNWGYILKERNGYKYRTFKDWLHNSFLLGLKESKETNSRKTPLVCLKWLHNASGDNKKRRLFKKNLYVLWAYCYKILY